MVEQGTMTVLSSFFHFISSLGQMARSAKRQGEAVLRRRSTNSFNSEMPGESGWHQHRGGQFIIVENGISHLRTELGAWIIPARRVGWVPPGVRHASRASGRGRGWVLLAPPGQSKAWPQEVCVLQISALMQAALERLREQAPHDIARSRLLWRVVAAEMRDAAPEPFEVPMPSTTKILQAVQSLLKSPTLSKDLNDLSRAAGMSRRSFTRHFRRETGLTFAHWKRAVIAHYAMDRIACGDKVSAVAFEVGYDSVSAFIAMFRRKYGAAPRAFLTSHAQRYLRRS
jgi:AraC-like DNA-binding protein/quercetin dioxygenase-like cupin family protein